MKKSYGLGGGPERNRVREFLKAGCVAMNNLPIVVVLLASVLVRPVDRSLAAETKYQFTHDWVSDNAPVWTKHLQQFKGKPNIHALEIGTFKGRAAIWFLDNILHHPTSSITCIDLFRDYIGGAFEHRFDHNIKVSGFSGRVKKIKGSSHTVLRNLKFNTYDFVYIDGSHVAKDVLMDAILSWDLLKVGGIIIFDDYRWHEHEYGRWRRPQIAIDAFLHVFKPYVEVLHKDYQVIVQKKQDPGEDFLTNFGEEPGRASTGYPQIQ
jgi:predicted O-methyltransferase YrrM